MIPATAITAAGLPDSSAGTQGRAGERVVHDGVQEYGDNAQAPYGTERRTKGPKEQGGEHHAKREASLGCPLQPVVMCLVGEQPWVDDGVAGIDGGPGAQTGAEPRVGRGHLEGGHGKLAAHGHWVRRPETAPYGFPSHHGGKD